MLPFVVIHQIHANTISGTDALKDFKPVIDLDENTLTPQGCSQFGHRVSRNLTLRESALRSDCALEARLESSRTSKGRALCTAHDDKVIVEISSPSTKEVVIKEGIRLAAATVIPASAFSFEAPSAQTGKQGADRTVTKTTESR
ncbi:hypothetical protein Pcac1_g14043 [Phytophthora cactorum]|uniref:Uncharacterized protein n=1 Tax=Phytophthora cactorum TaxID=29920 RepID=A0A8T1B8G8_9STRA|nr:hypothetical protein Pcac1_g14043 [Phytophthora cactorum]KAG2797725.1 hypothetical protein PC112_g21657 [Phytophthora cactorum]KAG2876747.1 hypothetical protein PC114_g24036 [Phytophthora cactorum]KAG2884331.1 hypothetical protein PC115_g21370 [Phytophthora cactorum]KAG2896475.1 hypothetical protein PC117_g22990 [Phytophthora cactorum]